jgi:two-component system, sensor histidine kinase and response regulator
VSICCRQRKRLFNTWADALHPNDRQDAETLIQDAAQGSGAFNTEFRVVLPDGFVRTIQAAAIVEKHEETGALKRMVGVNWDITERKMLENSIQDAKELAESISRSKSEFLANMSHEIRTPMNAVIGLADLALQANASPKIHDYLTKIFNSSKSLLRIINDILDFSKIEAGKLDLESSDFYLREVFEHLSDMFRPQTTKKHLELIMCISEECRYELHGDSLRLEQVLLNLIGNAIKFTEEGEVEIQVKTLKETVDQVTLEFSIRDTGIGMSAAQTSKLFQAFNQADSSTTRKFGGTGLGLSISKKLVEMMDGQIWVDSKPGRGSIFYFTATMKRNMGIEDVDMIPPQDMQHMRALVVDDNFTAMKSIQKTLEMFSFATTGVTSGLEAIEAVKEGIKQKKPYQLILVDWFMPGMNGITAIGQIKDSITTGTVPKMLLLTTFDSVEELRPQGTAAGVDEYVSKPVNCSLLFDTIMDVFGKDVAKAFRVRQDSVDPVNIMNKIGGASVLLVEDNAINRQVASEVLQGIGLFVDIAEDGLQAIEQVEKSTYDVVLMDIQMPEMDGLQATRKIRSDTRFQELPILAMTAHAMAGDRETSLQAGMNDHIAKPIDRKKLYGALVEWIKPRKGLGLSELPESARKTEENMTPIAKTIAGINMSDAMDILGGDQRLLRALLFEFHRSHANIAQTIRAELSGHRQDDILSARQHVHRIKGVAGNLAAKRLYDAANVLELGIVQAPQNQSKQLEEFESALDEIIESIKTIKQQEKEAAAAQEKSNNSAEKTAIDLVKITPIIHELSKLIEGVDIKSEEALEKLKPLLSGATQEVKKELAHLEEQIDMFDFDGAFITLTTIAKKLDVDFKGGAT